jgi:hypothetical protein
VVAAGAVATCATAWTCGQVFYGTLAMVAGSTYLYSNSNSVRPILAPTESVTAIKSDSILHLDGPHFAQLPNMDMLNFPSVGAACEAYKFDELYLESFPARFSGKSAEAIRKYTGGTRKDTFQVPGSPAYNMSDFTQGDCMINYLTPNSRSL